MSTDLSASDWVKGIALSVLATIIGGASKLAIRKSWLMEEEMDEDDSEVYSQVVGDENHEILSDASSQHQREQVKTKRTAKCLRLSGMFGMTFLNPFCGVMAMNYASPSITTPFSGLTLVWIVLFSKSLIGEEPSRMQVFAATLIVVGEVVVAVFGDHTNDEGVTLADLIASYKEPAFIAYCVAMVLWLLLMAHWMKYATSPFLKRFAWGVAGGSLTGMQNFLKDGLTILKAGEGIPWYFPVVLMVAILIAFGGLLLLTACMKRYDVTYSSSMFVGSYVVSASIMSAAHYDTFGNLEGISSYILYPVGLLILVTGVGILVIEANEEIAPLRTSAVSVLNNQTLQMGHVSLTSAQSDPLIFPDQEEAVEPNHPIT